MYRPIKMYQIVCDRCGEVYFTNKTDKICYYDAAEGFRVETLCNE